MKSGKAVGDEKKGLTKEKLLRIDKAPNEIFERGPFLLLRREMGAEFGEFGGAWGAGKSVPVKVGDEVLCRLPGLGQLIEQAAFFSEEIIEERTVH
jgi:hypothetical protein